MKAENNELKLIYNSAQENDKKTLGYAKALENLVLNERDIAKDNLTVSQIVQLAGELPGGIAALINKNTAVYRQEVAGKDFSEEDIALLMEKNPTLMRTPIACVGRRVFMVMSPYDLVKEGIEVEGVKKGMGNADEVGG